ncbi:unnamed protein product [Schistocephalus solidus]|uniref:Reverse transcriptase domain-containing protein n=1 Tax=Schistocephalus solidus TaxID=70667 RepID=A0A183T994_SCHSO|nr:unnamed protein product [Schistocephalus solidus]
MSTVTISGYMSYGLKWITFFSSQNLIPISVIFLTDEIWNDLATESRFWMPTTGCSMVEFDGLHVRMGAGAVTRRIYISNQISEKLEGLHAPDDNATEAPRKEAAINQISEKLEGLHAPDDNATEAPRKEAAIRQHQDWFDDNDAAISNLLAEKNRLHKAYMDLRTDTTKAAFFRCRRLVQQRLREMQDASRIRNAEEIQGYADRNEMKNVFKAIKEIAPLLSSDGTTLLTEKSQILKQWAEQFRSVLNCFSAISDAAIDRLPEGDTNKDLDLPPSLPETIRALQQISSGKALGADAITPEVYKHGGPRLMAEHTTFFQEMWRQGQFPQDFKRAIIVYLYKRKGNRQRRDWLPPCSVSCSRQC